MPSKCSVILTAAQHQLCGAADAKDGHIPGKRLCCKHRFWHYSSTLRNRGHEQVPKGCMRAGARTGGHARKTNKSTLMMPFVVQQLLRRPLTQRGQYEPIEVGQRASLTSGHLADVGLHQRRIAFCCDEDVKETLLPFHAALRARGLAAASLTAPSHGCYLPKSTHCYLPPDILKMVARQQFGQQARECKQEMRQNNGYAQERWQSVRARGQTRGILK